MLTVKTDVGKDTTVIGEGRILKSKTYLLVIVKQKANWRHCEKGHIRQFFSGDKVHN